MNFLYPTFLFALSAISIPIIVHLFNFRRYKVEYFSNVQFLKNIQQETKAKSRIKHFLILLLRILAVASLVFAFSQPFIPSANTSVAPKQDIVCIYIDNSFSMDSESKFGNMLEVAKNKVHGILDAFPASTKFLLTTNDFELKHQHLVTKDQFIDFLGKIQVSPNSRKLSEIISHQKDFIAADNSSKSRSKIFIISDFQKSFANFNSINNDSLLNVQLIPIIAQPVNNLYIDSCWFESPFRKYKQQEEIFVKVVNKSAEGYNNIPIKILINDSLKAIASFNIQPNSSEVVGLKFTNTSTGFFSGVVEISDYPVIYDNTFYFSFSIAENLNVLIINNQAESKYLKALYASDDYFKINNISEKNIQSSMFSSYNTIILNEMKNLSSGFVQEILAYVNNGGTVAFIPAIDGNIESYNSLLSLLKANTILVLDTHKIRLDYVNYSNPIYLNVFQKKEENADMPVLAKYFDFTEIAKTGDEPLLKMQNQKVALSLVQYGKGTFYSLSFPLSSEANNFAKHPLFVPTFYNIVFNSNLETKLYYVIGIDNTIELAKTDNAESDQVFHIISTKTKTDFIPQHSLTNAVERLFMQNNINKAGNYEVRFKNKMIATLAYNYNRSESDLNYFSDSKINSEIEKQNLSSFSILDTDTKFLSGAIERMSKGTQLWKLFVILTLFFLACEIAVIRLWK